LFADPHENRIIPKQELVSFFAAIGEESHGVLNYDLRSQIVISNEKEKHKQLASNAGPQRPAGLYG
jgi:hypothetical protein